jgi:hypothetical protein
MVARGSDGIFRTQPVESHALPVAATDDDQPDFSGWEAWMQGHKNETLDACGRALGIVADKLESMIAKQADRIAELELELATARGAIDILRGRGAPGALRVRGTFDADAADTYLANDVVAINGSSFVALKDRPGDCPGDGWQLLCSVGRRGERGMRGAIGPIGPAAPALKWLSFDSARMALIITMADASQTTVPLAGLFKSVRVDPADYSIKFSMRDGAELAFSLRDLFQQYDNEKCGR